METVYAYRDDGLMMGVSRWRPRRIFCTTQADHSDKPGIEHVVKLGQGAAGAAAQISEVVCASLLAAGGMPVLETRLVHVGLGFAAAYDGNNGFPAGVAPGRYFGTVRRHDVENGPPPKKESVANLQEIVDVWAFDSWFCNIDRNVEGNFLLFPGNGGRWQLLAADQSDCFGGSGRLADGSWRQVLADNRAAESVAFLQTAIYDSGGAVAIENSIARVRTAVGALDHAFSEAPDEWWRAAGNLDRDELKESLRSRARRMEVILNLKHWEDLDDATRGGHILF